MCLLLIVHERAVVAAQTPAPRAASATANTQTLVHPQRLKTTPVSADAAAPLRNIVVMNTELIRARDSGRSV